MSNVLSAPMKLSIASDTVVRRQPGQTMYHSVRMLPARSRRAASISSGSIWVIAA